MRKAILEIKPRKYGFAAYFRGKLIRKFVGEFCFSESEMFKRGWNDAVAKKEIRK